MESRAQGGEKREENVALKDQSGGRNTAVKWKMRGQKNTQ